MSQSIMQKIYQLLIFVMLIGLSISRPNGSVDNQDAPPSTALDNQLGLTEFEKNFPYRPVPSAQYFNFDEPSPIEKYQMQYRSFYPSAPIFRGGGGGSASLPIWDTYRQLVSKRQTRYRQCYFNPISCFRK